MADTFDVVYIGSGPGGYTGAIRAAFPSKFTHFHGSATAAALAFILLNRWRRPRGAGGLPTEVRNESS